MNKMTSVLHEGATLPSPARRAGSYEHARASPPVFLFKSYPIEIHRPAGAPYARAAWSSPVRARGRQRLPRLGRAGSRSRVAEPRRTDTPGRQPAPTRTRSKYIRKANMRSCVRASLRPQTSATTRRLKTNVRDGSTPGRAPVAQRPAVGRNRWRRRRLCPTHTVLPPSFFVLLLLLVSGHVEFEEDDVAILHLVVLALLPVLARLLHLGLALVVLLPVAEVVHLCLDEAALEVGVDGAGRLRCRPPVTDRPALDLVRAGCVEVDQRRCGP